MSHAADTPPSDDVAADPSAIPAQDASPALRARSVLAGVLVATLLVAVDLLAVTAALPEIAGDLGLDRAVALPVGASVVGLVLAVPVAARAAGRGPRWGLLLAASALVVVGGVAVALAGTGGGGPGSTGQDGAGQDSAGVVAAVGLGRLAQGAGAGAVVVVAGAALGSAVPAALQARVQAALVLVTGAGALLGALLGGLVSDVPGGWRAAPLAAPVLALLACLLLRSVRSVPLAPGRPAPDGARPPWRARVVVLGAVVGGVVGAVAVLGLTGATLALGPADPVVRGLLLALAVLAAVVGVVLASTAIARVGAHPHLAQVGTVGAVLAAVGAAGIAWPGDPGQRALPLVVGGLVLAGLGLGTALQGTGLVVSVLAPEGAERAAAGALGAARRAGALVGAVVVLLLPLAAGADATGADVTGPSGAGLLGWSGPVAALLLVLALPVLVLLPRRGDARHPPAA